MASSVKRSKERFMAALERTMCECSLGRDPFDRMLVCQAIVGGMTIVTPDSAIRAYPVSTRW